MTELDTAPPSKPSRRPRTVFLPVALCAAVLGVGLWTGRKQADTVPEYPLLKGDAAELKSTLITPHLEEAIEPDRNLLWCSTFQLVWNELCDAAGGEVHLQHEPPAVGILNRKNASTSDLDAASCLVMSGMVKDGIVPQIRQALEAKFHGQADPALLNRFAPSLPPDSWLGYAYLFRDLPFEYPFKRLEAPLRFAHATDVASFGIRPMTALMDDMHRAGQVTVADYRNADDFVVELKPLDPNERIILANIPPAATLQETIEQVRARRAGVKEDGSERLMPNEAIVMPVLNFDLLREYDELYGKPIIAPAGPLNGMPIILAVQSIRFRLDERGAILKSEAAIALCAGQPEPRLLIFDKPFIILLERTDAKRPYFALWVANAELLVPAH